MANEIDIQKTIQQQTELIKQLRTAISRLEKKLMAVNKKATRTADVARRATNDINTLTRSLRSRN